MFDIATLDTLTLSEEGVPMPVAHPKTRKALIGSNGTPITVTLLGKNSDTARAAMRRQADRASERASRGIVSSPEDRERNDAEFLAACTKAWTFDQMDGAPFPCTSQNAEKLWSDQRFRWLREQALAFILEDGNFIRD